MHVLLYLVWVVGVALEPGPRRWLFTITVIPLATVLQNAKQTLMCMHMGISLLQTVAHCKVLDAHCMACVWAHNVVCET